VGEGKYISDDPVNLPKLSEALYMWYLLFLRCGFCRWMKKQPRINLLCKYTEHTDELQLEDLKAADCRLQTGWLKKISSWLGSICVHLYVYVLAPVSIRLK
jgi:hypothetical protein